MAKDEPTRDSEPETSDEGAPMEPEAKNPFARVLKDPPLSRSQARALENVKDTLERMMEWHGKTKEEIETDPCRFNLCYEDFKKAMIRAVRAGLADHPAVKPWVLAQRGIGNRKTLRRARSGVEKGMKPSLTDADVRLWGEIHDLAKEYEKLHGTKISQAKARKLLVARSLVGQSSFRRRSRQYFHKLLKKLNLLHYFDR